MKGYVETNFVLELVFQQEQSASCEEIVELCIAGKLRLIVPAYSLIEPYEKLTRQKISRKVLQRSLEVELNQLARTSSYQEQMNSVKDVYKLLVQSSVDEKQKLVHYRNIFLENAEIIPMTADILTAAIEYESRLSLSPQDAIVYASALAHLRQEPRGEAVCFLNRNARDFDKPEIRAELAQHECALIYRFDQGLRFMRAQVAQA